MDVTTFAKDFLKKNNIQLDVVEDPEHATVGSYNSECNTNGAYRTQ